MAHKLSMQINIKANNQIKLLIDMRLCNQLTGQSRKLKVLKMQIISKPNKVVEGVEL